MVDGSILATGRLPQQFLVEGPDKRLTVHVPKRRDSHSAAPTLLGAIESACRDLKSTAKAPSTPGSRPGVASMPLSSVKGPILNINNIPSYIAAPELFSIVLQLLLQDVLFHGPQDGTIRVDVSQTEGIVQDIGCFIIVISNSLGSSKTSSERTAGGSGGIRDSIDSTIGHMDEDAVDELQRDIAVARDSDCSMSSGFSSTSPSREATFSRVFKHVEVMDGEFETEVNTIQRVQHRLTLPISLVDSVTQQFSSSPEKISPGTVVSPPDKNSTGRRFGTCSPTSSFLLQAMSNAHNAEGRKFASQIFSPQKSSLFGQQEHERAHRKSDSHILLRDALSKSLPTQLPSQIENVSLGTFLGRKNRILVIEDSKLCQDMFVRALQGAGYDTDVAGDGNTAIAKLKTTPNAFDAIFVDACMSGSESEAVIRFCRSDLKLTIPIIAVTGDGENSTYQRLVEAGANGCFLKPISLENMVAVLRKHDVYGKDTQR